ncbi:DNA-binding protein [Aliarcobacter butzleri]|uniref:DNA-binding protein n=1 Tax=Aliarcobacter butzleri TaxID=28197 RepID=UPI0012FB4FC3|nr:DNA-binding protein [Aliarcobacter butzleri]
MILPKGNIISDISNLVVYSDGELELKVSVNNQTVWLSADEIVYIFNVNRPAIVKHIGNIYKDEELEQNSTCSILEQVAKFRKWSTTILKDYINDGYAINHHKITEQRLLLLENDVNVIKSKIKDNKLETNQRIFYDGQIYDSYSFINDLLKIANNEVILIDNYVDDTVLTLFSKYQNINFIIYTNNISKQLKLDFEKYSKQYKNITLKTFKSSHDRFLIVDKKEIYHIGASLKDLAKKWFAFSKINLSVKEILEKLN